jgi:dCTP deaminase
VAIISFAGLDTENTLHLPLLVHELGHFIDYARPMAETEEDQKDDRFRLLSESSEMRATSNVKLDDFTEAVTDALDGEIDTQTIAEYYKELVKRIGICRREILADLLAARMIGLPYFCAQAEFLKSLFLWNEPRVTSGGYPGMKFRLGITFHEIMDAEAGIRVADFFHQEGLSTNPEHAEIAGKMYEYFMNWSRRLEDIGRSTPSKPSSVNSVMEIMAIQAIERTLPGLQTIARRLVPAENIPAYSKQYFQRIRALYNNFPPFMEGDSREGRFAEVLSASWVYQLIHGAVKEWESQTNNQEKIYRMTCNLVLKAIELSSTPGVEDVHEDTTPGPLPDRRGVVVGNTIRKRIALPIDDPRRLGIVPYSKRCVNPSSLDIRLGHWFKIARRTRIPSLNLSDKSTDLDRIISSNQESIFIRPHETLVMHPGDLVLGSTLEFFALPNDMMAFVEGKSSLGRMGLIIATATQIAPGFHGIIVLELVNDGVVPVQLAPGMPIGQLVLIRLEESVDPYNGRYDCQIRP